jgi:hypothetical protein
VWTTIGELGGSYVVGLAGSGPETLSGGMISPKLEIIREMVAVGGLVRLVVLVVVVA